MKRALLLLALCGAGALAAAAPASAQQCPSSVVCLTQSPSHVNFGAVGVGETKTVDVTYACESGACGLVIIGFNGAIPAGSGFSETWGISNGLCANFDDWRSFPPGPLTLPTCVVRYSMTGTEKGHWSTTLEPGLAFGPQKAGYNTIRLSGTTR